MTQIHCYAPRFFAGASVRISDPAPIAARLFCIVARRARPAFDPSITRSMLIIHSGRFIAFRNSQVGLNLGVLEVHLLAGVVDQRNVERAMRHERGHHVPISVDLQHKAATPAARSHDLEKLARRPRQELAADVGACLPHHRLAPQFVQLQNQFRLLDGIRTRCSLFRFHLVPVSSSAAKHLRLCGLPAKAKKICKQRNLPHPASPKRVLSSEGKKGRPIPSQMCPQHLNPGTVSPLPDVPFSNPGSLELKIFRNKKCGSQFAWSQGGKVWRNLKA